MFRSPPQLMSDLTIHPPLGPMSLLAIDVGPANPLDPTLVGKENEKLFIRVWKPLFSRRDLKILRENSKKTISISTELGRLHKTCFI